MLCILSMAGNFEKTNLGWQIQRWQMQIGEAMEKALQPDSKTEVLTWSVPDWVLRVLFWTIALSLTLWVLWQLYQLFQPYLALEGFVRPRQHKTGPTVAAPLSEAQWLQRSQSLARQGNYREACRALYHALLQKLDAMAIVPAQASRTDGEYLDCLQILPDPRPYQALIQVHEELCFGNAVITQETFHRCEQAYRELEI